MSAVVSQTVPCQGKEEEEVGGERLIGDFFYLVNIPVGSRLEPNIMSTRVGKGFKLNTVVQGSERFTPFGSPITYVKLIKNDGWVFETTMDNQVVLDMFQHNPQRNVDRTFYKVLKNVDIMSKPDVKSVKLNTRVSGSVLECSETLIPHGSPFSYFKLRHDDGWAMDTNEDGDTLMEHIKGDAVLDNSVKFYKVLIAVAVRHAPDMDCNRIPGVAPKAIGAVIGSSLRYTLPGGGMTFVKLLHENGWIFEQTPKGQIVLEAMASNPDRKIGKFFFKALERLPVYSSPVTDKNTLVRFIEKSTMFAIDQMFTLPDDDTETSDAAESNAKKRQTFLRLPDDNKAWICQENVLVVSEELYNLFLSPPSWVALGFPNRKWHHAAPEGLGSSILAEETLRQTTFFSVRNILGSTSQGQDSIPISRVGYVVLTEDGDPMKVTLEEIKHPSSNLFFTFAWKQIWFCFHMNDDGKSMNSSLTKKNHHAIEIQHGLRGGFRSILFDGVEIENSRPVVGMLWDHGSVHEFQRLHHTFRVKIALEGHFFSTSSQFYSYTFEIDGLCILQGKFETQNVSTVEEACMSPQPQIEEKTMENIITSKSTDS